MSNSQIHQQAPLSAEVGIELSQVIRYGDEQQTLIWVEPICKMFKIGYDHHRKLIKNDPILQSIQRKKADYLAFGDNRQRILLPKVGFIRWIQLINPNTVDPELRDKLIGFQTKVFDYIYDSVQAREAENSLYKEFVHLENERARINARIKTVRTELRRMQNARILGHGTQTTLQLKEVVK